jgi:hypothetical protein
MKHVIGELEKHGELEGRYIIDQAGYSPLTTPAPLLSVPGAPPPHAHACAYLRPPTPTRTPTTTPTPRFVALQELQARNDACRFSYL